MNNLTSKDINKKKKDEEKERARLKAGEMMR